MKSVRREVPIKEERYIVSEMNRVYHPTKKTPWEVEKEFHKIGEQIRQSLLKTDFRIPPASLFQEYDNEYEKVERIYTERNDQKNLLHAKHNYMWRKSFQYLQENPTQSLELIIGALSALLKRNELSKYPTPSFEKMLAVYEVALIKIDENWNLIEFNQIEKKFKLFLENHFSEDIIESENLNNVINSFFHLFIERRYDEKIKALRVGFSNLDEIEEIITNIELSLIVLEKVYSVKKSYLPSLCYEYLYKLRKKHLHFLVNSIFFAASDVIGGESQKKIDQIAEKLIIYSKKSHNYYKSYYKKLSLEKQEDKNVKLTITLKELDELTSSYYREAYSSRNIFKAWMVIDKIKQFLVLKAFKEEIPLSDNLLRYFAEEWSLLYVFAKISLLEEEIERRIPSLGEKWEEEIFNKIVNSLRSLQRLFKYEVTDESHYALKIMNSQFAGGFSEYFIYKLCQDFFDFGIINNKTSSDFERLLKCVKLAKNKDDIAINEVIEQGKPDIDIYIRSQCAIFLKNAKIESGEVKKIWEEIELCEKEGITKIFYGFNFIKNVQSIDYIRQSFERIRTTYRHISIEIFDIKDMVGTFLEELKRSGKSKPHFSEFDLYKVLDY